MNSRFAKAVAYNPKSRKILGRTLLPICIRQRVVLEYYNSPFVTGKEPTVEDIVFAVRVMSTFDKDEMHRAPNDAEVEAILMLRQNDEAMYSIIEDIREHINENANWPIFWEKEGGGHPNGIPWHMTVVANLVRNGVSYDQAWTMPEAEAVWLYTCNLAHEGTDIRVVSDEDRATMEAHKAAVEEMKKQEAQNNV
jgi:hypothetical protein